MLAPVDSLLVIQRIFHGKPLVAKEVGDFSSREILMMGLMMLVTIGLGLYPQPVMEIVSTGLQLSGL